MTEFGRHQVLSAMDTSGEGSDGEEKAGRDETWNMVQAVEKIKGTLLF